MGSNFKDYATSGWYTKLHQRKNGGAVDWILSTLLMVFFLSFQSTPVGTTIYKNILAQDQDAGVNGLVEYFLMEGSQNISSEIADKLTVADGFGVFAISYPHQGQVSSSFFDFSKIRY